jgi:hypothetical protein
MGGMSGVGGAAAGSGGASGGGPDPIICARFTGFEAGENADNIRVEFERASMRDCRLSWFLTLYLPPVDERAEFGQNLIQLSLKLWGCVAEAPTAFSLIHTPVPLSPAEARALIDLYLNASRTEAQLSPSELAFVERELLRLASPLIDETLEDFSRSRCPDGGMGGSGGAGGAPGGHGGIGEGGLGDGGSLASSR